MTPQEIFEYKRSWLPGYAVQVDVDNDVWGKYFCMSLCERKEWSFKAFTQQNDSHTFYFKDITNAEKFIEEYRLQNEKFETNII